MHAEAGRLKGKPKPSLSSPPKPRKKQINDPKLACWLNYKKANLPNTLFVNTLVNYFSSVLPNLHTALTSCIFWDIVCSSIIHKNVFVAYLLMQEFLVDKMLFWEFLIFPWKTKQDRTSWKLSLLLVAQASLNHSMYTCGQQGRGNTLCGKHVGSLKHINISHLIASLVFHRFSSVSWTK